MQTQETSIFLPTLLVASLLAVAFKSAGESVRLLQKFIFSLFPGLRLSVTLLEFEQKL